MTIELSRLRYFNAMVTTGFISRAAEKVHIAQLALGLYLKMMKTERGVKLLERTPLLGWIAASV